MKIRSVVFRVVGLFAAGNRGGEHVLVTEFRDMALNGLFCADVLRPLDLVPLTDSTYKIPPRQFLCEVAQRADIVKTCLFLGGGIAAAFVFIQSPATSDAFYGQSRFFSRISMQCVHSAI